ncbi:MAG: 23S rRNA (adenine(2503)-C(2))-methyltransferase RlmN [Helicobacteraceae bacterium]|jgi:23S rRNA (adenine2503-C2)-methyltransferase|nr:23S rRNA (adenine(2503)-C(2))-methyltransferase RlmN [Helicobacteraceae bacterium]
MKRLLLDLTPDELKLAVSPDYRSRQLFQFIYRQYGENFNALTTFPKKIRAALDCEFTIEAVKIAKKQNADDGSIKYLFRLNDDLAIESVALLMRGENADLRAANWTVCVSTQVGCKVGCAFCLSGKRGFFRNLTAGEIAAQVLMVKKDLGLSAEKAVNVVYMGMGEPLDNIENLRKAVSIISAESGLNISPRRQTVSTSGIAPKIDLLGAMKLGVLLAISLHAVDDGTRNQLIPMNKAFNIARLLESVRRFPIDLRKRVMFEYLMLKGINDSLSHANKLIRLLNGIRAKVNLIVFNPYIGSEFERPDQRSIEAFQRCLLGSGLFCTVRVPRGAEIDAACGQLQERQIVSCET